MVSSRWKVLYNNVLKFFTTFYSSQHTKPIRGANNDIILLNMKFVFKIIIFIRNDYSY